MAKRIFIDSDVLLDVALERAPFALNSAKVLTYAQNNLILGFTSSVCLANVFYFIRKFKGKAIALRFISELLAFTAIIPTDHAAVLGALQSGFDDFEDGMQYYTALSNRMNVILTRNKDDYKVKKETEEIAVYSPDEFVAMLS
jgi:predicted nucleic acid-binding protein